MKKVITICFILFACIMGGCSPKHYDDEAIQLYIDTMQQEIATESMHLGMKGFLYEDTAKEQMLGKLSLDCDMILSDSLQMAVDMNAAASGISFGDIHFYIKDNVMYLDMLGEKTQMPFPELLNAMMLLMSNQDVSSSVDADAVKEYFKEFKFEDKDQGIITFTFDIDKLAEVAGNSEDANIKDVIKSYTGTMTLQEEGLKELTFDMLMNIEGTQYPVSITIECSKRNEIKELQFPDFKDFELQDTDDEYDDSLFDSDFEDDEF